MGKDPAFLFYPEKFITGTALMSYEQKGKHIFILCLMHQQGGLMEKADFEEIANGDKKLIAKYVETEDGYFNEKLMEEIEKRKKKSENLSANAQKRWNEFKQKQCKSNAIASNLDMPTININTNVIKDKNKRFKPPTIEEIKAYCKERNNKVDPQRFINHYQSNGWMVGKNKMKDWKAAVRTWEGNNFDIDKSESKLQRLMAETLKDKRYE